METRNAPSSAGGWPSLTGARCERVRGKPEQSDQGARQLLFAWARNGRINPTTMYLGTREGNIHYWTHSGHMGTLNFNFSNVFVPYNIFSSTTLY